MDAQTLISLLGFSKTLIQDAEIKMLWYEHYPTSPEERGKFVQEGIEYSKQEYRDAFKKTSRPEALRKAILQDIENYKTYGFFHDSDEFFHFQEVNLVFQRPGAAGQLPQCNFRAENIFCFDNFPTASDAPFPAVEFARYYDGGRQENRVVNSDQRLVSTLPHQIDNGRIIGDMSVDTLGKEDSLLSRFPIRHPPAVGINKTEAQIEPAEVDGEDVFIITHFPFEKVLKKTYVRPADIPQIFREEYYYKSESKNANEDGYWLRLVEEYRDFVPIETLGIAYPKFFEAKEYRPDGFMRRNEIITIIEMAFNQGLPSNFFDWNLQEYRNTSKESEAP